MASAQTVLIKREGGTTQTSTGQQQPIILKPEILQQVHAMMGTKQVCTDFGLVRIQHGESLMPYGSKFKSLFQIKDGHLAGFCQNYRSKYTILTFHPMHLEVKY